MDRIFLFFRDDVWSLPIWCIVVFVLSGVVTAFWIFSPNKDATGQADNEAIKKYKKPYY